MMHSSTHRPTHRFPLSAVYLFVLQWHSIQAEPTAARWASTPLGPDGPWNAITVKMGGNSPGQDVTVYAGKMLDSYFLGGSYCLYTLNTGESCYASDASAIYNEISGTGQNPNVKPDPSPYFTENLQMTGSSSPQRWTETIHLGDNSTDTGPLRVDSLSMVLAQDLQVQYPNGNKYPLFAGCLAFGGAPGKINETFLNSQNSQEQGQGHGQETSMASYGTNTSLLAGTMFASGGIDSNSFGMHIGSVQPVSVPGSLWFGGYDRNRAVRDMLSMPINEPYNRWVASLADVSIDVVSGGSPFPWNSKSGFLTSGNSSIGKQLELAIDPCIPYLNLPKSTCDAIAAELPVTHDEGLGLYLWNNASADYSRIIQSASALTFTFLDPSNKSRRVNISVPFMHLNLTLDQPLASSPTPYFPCFSASPNGQYALGRAFLQDAFLGANFETSTYFLSQAPGPNVNGPDVSVIELTTTALDASGDDWVDSWDGTWSPLPVTQGQAFSSASYASRRTVDLAVGLTVGLGGGSLLLGLLGLIARRYQKYGKGLILCGFPLIKDKPKLATKEVEELDVRNDAAELPETLGPQQLPGDVHQKAAELEQPRVVHEMPGDAYWPLPGYSPREPELSGAYQSMEKKEEGVASPSEWRVRRRSF